MKGMACPQHPRVKGKPHGYLLTAWSGLWPSKSCGPGLKQLQNPLGLPKNGGYLNFAICSWENDGPIILFSDKPFCKWTRQNSSRHLQADSSWWWFRFLHLWRPKRFWLYIYNLVGGFNPSEKYESQLGWLFPIYEKIKNVPNHQPEYKLMILTQSASLSYAGWWC